MGGASRCRHACCTDTAFGGGLRRVLCTTCSSTLPISRYTRMSGAGCVRLVHYFVECSLGSRGRCLPTSSVAIVCAIRGLCQTLNVVEVHRGMCEGVLLFFWT